MVSLGQLQLFYGGIQEIQWHITLCSNHLLWLIMWFFLVFFFSPSNTIGHSGRGDRTRWWGYLPTVQTAFSIFSGGNSGRPIRRQNELQHFCQEQLSKAKGQSRNHWKPCFQQPTGEIFWQICFRVCIGLFFPTRQCDIGVAWLLSWIQNNQYHSQVSVFVSLYSHQERS